MRIGHGFLLSLGALVLSALIGGHLNSLHPALDSLSHFRLHLAVIGILIALLLLPTRHQLGSSALGIFSVLSFTVTVWPSLSAQQANAATSGATYRLLQANLRFNNHTPEDFIRLLGETKPDVAAVEEISVLWINRLKTVSDTYPFQYLCPGVDAIGGVAIISRRPFVDGGPSICAGQGALAVRQVNFGGQPVTIVAAHLEWPWPKLQPQQLIRMRRLFERIKSAGAPVLIGGDMNATPWSAAVATIAQETGTKVLPQAWGTWIFTSLPRGLAPWLGLPLDNILASDTITLQSATTQRAIGSDHRPILVEFTLPQKASPGRDESLTG
jgi:endonuclease/exonuclease/phosphatase (EEP) superfamily protein YafD